MNINKLIETLEARHAELGVAIRVLKRETRPAREASAVAKAGRALSAATAAGLSGPGPGPGKARPSAAAGGSTAGKARPATGRGTVQAAVRAGLAAAPDPIKPGALAFALKMDRISVRNALTRLAQTGEAKRTKKGWVIRNA